MWLAIESPLGHRGVADLPHQPIPQLSGGLRRSAGADPMTAAGVIAPVVPPPPGAGRTAARDGVVSLARKPLPLPLPDLPPQRTSAVVYGASTVDDRGRVVDRVVLRALGWRAGHRLNIHEAAGTLTVVPDSAGDHQVTGQGHLRLITGDRVLLAADPDRARLAIYPPAALDRALVQPPTRTGGDPE